jgi:hypothetical protein
MRRFRDGALHACAAAAALALASAALAQASAADDGLPSILDDCGSLAPAPSARHVRDKAAKLGHLEIDVADAVATPIVGKSGRLLGVYLEGSGGYRYTSADAQDQATLTANLARVAKSLHAAEGGVADRFTRALILFSEPVFREDWDEPSGGEPSPPVAGPRVADLLRGALGSTPEFDFRVARARLNADGRYAYVELDGSAERVGYVYDEALSGQERLFTFRKLVDYAVRLTEPLSTHGIPGWSAGRSHWAALTHVDIAMETPDNKSGSIASDLTFTVHGAGTRLLSLALLNSFDPDARNWDSTKYKLVVGRVTDAQGKDLPFAHRYHELVVEIPRTEGAIAGVHIRVETSGEVFLDMSGHHADNYFIFHGDPWFPTPLGWGGEQFTYSLKVKTKKPWRPVTSGKETVLKEDGDSLVAESASDHPSSLIGILAGKYVTREEVVDGVTIRVHCYASARKVVIETLPKLAGAIVKLYTALLGPMPAEELDVVEIPEYGFGISPSGIVLLTSEAYKPRENYVAEYLSRGINARLAHEIAHQWFGHKAMPRDRGEDRWIAESFAEYFAGVAMSAMVTDEKAMVGFPQMLAQWRAGSKICADVAPISMADSLGGDSGAWDRYCLLYDRGPLVLHMLQTMIGNDRFYGATKAFLEKADDGPASTGDFSKAVSDAVQADMTWYFDQWVRTPGDAHLTIEQRVESGEGGRYRLVGVIRQPSGAGFKKVVVPFVWDQGGKPTARLVLTEQPEQAFDIPLTEKPFGAIKPDPYQNNLAVYK